MSPQGKDLTGRIALIMGGSRGIGKAIALAFAREGADVMIAAKKEEELAAAKQEIEALGVRAYTCALDARDESQVKHMVETMVAPLGRLDILVNNIGGVMEHAKFEELEAHHWKENWELNFLTAVLATQATLPYIKKSSAGRILFTASSAAKQPGGFNPHYGTAKTALVALSKALANTYAPDGILVNAICPTTVNGGVWEEHIQDKALRNNVSFEEAKRLMEEEVIKKTPIGKIVTPEGVAELYAFLASDRAKFITGCCFQVDGGMIKSIF